MHWGSFAIGCVTGGVGTFIVAGTYFAYQLIKGMVD